MSLTLVRVLGVAFLTLHAAACAPPDQGAAGLGAALAVGMTNPASLAWLGDGRGGHASPLAGPPVQIAAGPGGSAVTLTAGAPGAGRMQLAVIQPGASAESRAAGPRLDGVETSGVARLAADGQRHAVVAYQRRPEARPLSSGATPTD